jgi:hypothetical protein
MKDTNGNWAFAAGSARNWFFQIIPTGTTELNLSDTLLPTQYQEFKSTRETAIPGMPEKKGAELDASVVFELKSSGAGLTPQLLKNFDALVTASPPGDDGTPYWTLLIPASVPDNVVQPFFADLVQVTVTVAPETSSSGN